MSGTPWIQNRGIGLNKEALLEIKDLCAGFSDEDGIVTPVIDDVLLKIYPGEFFGLAGESGCGKTVTALSLLRLLPNPTGRILSGRIILEGKDITASSINEVHKIRGKDVGMIFQEPSAAFNPLATIENQLMEVFDYHQYDGDPAGRVNELLARVGFSDPAMVLKAYPHELSGGMLQRVGICLALLLKPRLVIADEPTTALDVTVQAQIMELLVELQKEEETAVLFITHNLNLLAQYGDRLAVMYAGRIVESADVKSFFENPSHPYSRGLLRALPNLQSGVSEIEPIDGQVPKPSDFLQGCRFADRCPGVIDECVQKPPVYKVGKYHMVSCFLYKDTK